MGDSTSPTSERAIWSQDKQSKRFYRHWDNYFDIVAGHAEYRRCSPGSATHKQEGAGQGVTVKGCGV